MKLIKWNYLNLTIPMMEADDGELYCTTKAICAALGITEAGVWNTASNNKEEFETLSLTDLQAKEFFRKHKAEFGMLRVRADARLWNEDDMLTFAFHAQSSGAREFRKNLRRFIKENARKDVVTREEFDALHRLVLQTMPAISNTASLAGSLLRQQRGTKELREMLH